MWRSAKRLSDQMEDTVVSLKWRPAVSDRAAFIQEALWMQSAGWNGKGTYNFYNIINSPGHKYL